MNYKSYATAKNTPSRLTRKQARRTTFQYNRKLRKLARRDRPAVVR